MALLQTRNLTATYGDFRALFGVDIVLNAAETIAIIGANGAGKTTLMRSIAGVLRNTPGQILLDGQPIGGLPADEIVRLGVAMVPEGRCLFPSLSVEENLQIGAYGRKIASHWGIEEIYSLFPILGERRHMAASNLSGGQQQMAAIGRALMSNPRILLCDEISLGLAPLIIKNIYAAIPPIQESGTSLIIVEQDIGQALRIASRVYCMMEGRVTLEGKPDRLERTAIHNAYFGKAAI